MTTSCIVSFGSNALAIRDDAAITVYQAGLQPFADLDALESGTVVSKPYATYEPDYWLLDGNFKFAPDTNARGGYVGTVMSASSGAFNVGGAGAAIHILFDNVYSTDGLTLYFSNTGDYADSIQITFYNGAPITTDFYTPSSTVFSTGQAIANFNEIYIFFSSTNRAQRYARLMKIDFDTITRFEGSDIKAARVVQEINPLSVELSIDTLELDLFSTDGDFSIVAPAGFYANLQYKQPLDVHEDVNGNVIYIGRFYLDAWESLSESEAHFEASDAIGLMETIPYYGVLEHSEDIFPVGTTSLIDDIMDNTGLDYEIDAGITLIEHFGKIPPSNCREALQQVCFAIGAYVTCARSNIVNIRPFELASDLTPSDYDHVLTSAEKGIVSPLTLRPLVTGIEVTSHSYTPDLVTAAREVFRGYVAIGDHLITLEEPAHSNTFTGTTATYTTGTNAYFWRTINVTVAGNFIMQAQSFFDSPRVESLYNGSLPANTPPNIISITDATLVFPRTQPFPPSGPVYASIATGVVQRVYDYHAQRYLQKTKLYASLIAPGDSVLVNVQSSKQLAGIVEKMETDLAGGYISNVGLWG